MSTADLWGITLMLGGGLFAWWLANRLVERPDRAFVARVVAASFVLRAGWSLFQHVIYPRVWHHVAADAMARYAAGRREAALWREGLASPTLPETLQQAHTYLVQLQTTWLIYVFGESAMVVEAGHITVNVTLVIAAYLICRHIGGNRLAARSAAVLVAFLPSLMFWSTQIVRDPVTGACIGWAVLGMMKVGSRAHPGWLLVMVGAAGFAVIYRAYVGLLLIMGMGLAWAATVKLPPTALGRLTRVAMFAVVAPVVLHIGVQEMKQTYGDDMGVEWALDKYDSFRASGQARGGVHGSEYLIPLSASTPTQAIIQLPARVMMLLLEPIPIVPGSVRRMATYPEMWFIYLFILPRFVMGFKEAWQKNRSALVSILMVLAPLIVAYALKTSVSGEAIRMRSQFVPVLLIIAGIGHAVYARRKAAGNGRESAGSVSAQQEAGT